MLEYDYRFRNTKNSGIRRMKVKILEADTAEKLEIKINMFIQFNRYVNPYINYQVTGLTTGLVLFTVLIEYEET